MYPGKPEDSSPIEPKPTAWWLRPVSSAARVGEHSAVTWNRLNRTPSSAIRVMAGDAIGPPNALGFPNPASSTRTSSTLGAPSGGVTCPIRPQSGAEPASVRFAVPLNAGSGMGSLVRSIGASATAMSFHELPSRARDTNPIGSQPPGMEHHITRHG